MTHKYGNRYLAPLLRSRPAALLVSLTVLVATALAGQVWGVDEAADHHYIVIELDEHGFAAPVFHSRVVLAQPRESLTDKVIREARAGDLRGDDTLVVSVIEEGEVVFQDLVPLMGELRGEFHGRPLGGGFEIEHVRHRMGRPAVVVRVPAMRGAELVIEGRKRSAFSLDAIEAGRGELALASLDGKRGRVQSKVTTGSPSNRVDLLVMGDGYTATEAGVFAADADALIEAMFSITPYGEYANFINTSTLFTASSESGADHPPYDSACEGDDTECCADRLAVSDALAGTYVETAFDARYCAFNTHRLLVVDNARVLAEAASVPDWDEIFVVVNDTTYGGSGGRVAVASTHVQASDVIRHEYGHSFTGLADEYDTAYPGYPSCSDITGPPCQANVTDATTRAEIKWAPWIDPVTPVPTPENAGHGSEVGLFEGARYKTSDMYRPRDVQCLMRALGYPFCEVCTQTYVLKLYDGGWGVPGSGIDLIEPGTESPAVGAVQTVGAITLSVDLLQPVGGPGLDVEWRVNGEVQSGQTAPSFTFSPTMPGTYEVEIKVTDTTWLVNPAMAGSSLGSSRQWTVERGRSISYRRARERRRPVGARYGVTEL